ncbi:MAG: hypothetical protein ABIJ37_09150 [Pseudomonadota bacterium]
MIKVAVLILTFLITGLALAEQHLATEECKYQFLNQIHKVTSIDTRDNVIIRLIESGGGDPAMNGNVLLLTISEGSDGESFVWETGINMFDVQKVRSVPNHILIVEGTEHYMNSKGIIKPRPVKYQIIYSFTKEHLNKTIEVKKVN